MHTSNTEQNSKDNSMEWLSEELRLLKAGANIDTDVDIKQAHNSIRSHLLADVMRVIGEYETSEDDVENDLYFATRNGLRQQLRQAFNELLGGDK